MPPLSSSLQTFLTSPVLAKWIIPLMIWSLFWKGLALWHTAQRKQPWWFAAFLLVNTVGLLEIVYIFGIAKISMNKLFSLDSTVANKTPQN